MSFLLVWSLLSWQNFAYPTFYQWLSIDQTILYYGAQNHFKQGFELTQQSEHFRYFGQIVAAINCEEPNAILAKLKAITYQPVNSPLSIPLLRHAEIIHLMDVAALVKKIRLICLVSSSCCFIWFGCLLCLTNKNASLVVLKVSDIVRSVICITVLVGMLFAVFGFKAVFYYLHTWAFPADNQWFFYYQDSLMTTLMQAPYLFLYIGVCLAVLLLLCLFIFVFLLKLLIKKSTMISKLYLRQDIS